jgi:hypothetical protein
LGYDVPDPGIAKEGTKCGTNKVLHTLQAEVSSIPLGFLQRRIDNTFALRVQRHPSFDATVSFRLVVVVMHDSFACRFVIVKSVKT